MVRHGPTDERTGPDHAPTDLRFPPHVGDRLGAVYGSDRRISTVDGWIETVRAAVRTEYDREPSPADLCTVDDGPHVAVIDGTETAYRCVLDPLIVVFLRGEPGTVRSRSPGDGSPVTFDIDATGATVDPSPSVISVGVGHDGPPGEPKVATAHSQVCPYTHAFPSARAYERWAAGVDAATTSVPPERGIAMARELARAVEV